MTNKKIAGVVLLMLMILGGVFNALPEVRASEWQIVGPRALGMGGANVAVANDATASYWNPGAFGFFKGSEDDYYGKRRWSSTLAGVGVGAQLHGNIGDTLTKVTDIDFDGIDDNNITAAKVSNFIELLSAIEEFKGQKNQLAIVTANGRFGVQAGHFGFGGQVFVDVTANPNFDFDNLGPTSSTAFTITDFTSPSNLGCETTCSTSSISVTTLTTAQANAIDAQLLTLGWSASQRFGYINAVDNGLAQTGVTVPSDVVTQVTNAATLANTAAAGSGGPLSANKSTLQFKGIGLIEIPLTYGHAFSENLSIGGNLKYMKARVYDTSIDILNQDFGDALDKALDNYEEKNNFGIDLGALYRLGDSLRIGLVGRNINAPKFASITEEAQVRTGFAYQPWNFLTFAADIDLTENDMSAGSDLKSRNIGAGVEIALNKELPWYLRWIIPTIYRGGIYKNLAENDIGVVYTAGIGWDLLLFNLDIGVARSKDDTQLDGDDIPEEARAEFALTMLF